MLNWNRKEVKALFVSFKTVFCHELRFHISVLPFILLTIVDWYYFWGIDNTARITKFLFSHILPAKLAIISWANQREVVHENTAIVPAPQISHAFFLDKLYESSFFSLWLA